MTAPRRRGFATPPDGGRLAFELDGSDDKPAILLLRPLGGSMALWGPFRERLAERLTVIAFDPRGVGDSSDARWRDGTRDMARDAVALLDTLRIARAHVFGLSLGGMVASWLAIDHPARVERLVLASTLPKPSRVSHRVVQEVMHEALPLARAVLRWGAAAETSLVREILSPQFRRAHPDRVRAIEATVRAHPTSGTNLLRLALAAARHHATDELRAVRAPTLVLAGGLDPIIGRRAEAELLHDIPGAALSLIADSGHDLTLEQPLITADRVLAFLER